EAGKLDLDPMPFALREMVGDALKPLGLRAHKKGLELALRIHPNVPEGVEGDAGRLRQILINLVGNAIKFTEMGEILVDIKMEQGRQSNEVAKLPQVNTESASCLLHFKVRDTGIGIPAAKQRAVF